MDLVPPSSMMSNTHTHTHFDLLLNKSQPITLLCYYTQNQMGLWTTIGLSLDSNLHHRGINHGHHLIYIYSRLMNISDSRYFLIQPLALCMWDCASLLRPAESFFAMLQKLENTHTHAPSPIQGAYSIPLRHTNAGCVGPAAVTEGPTMRQTGRTMPTTLPSSPRVSTLGLTFPCHFAASVATEQLQLSQVTRNPKEESSDTAAIGLTAQWTRFSPSKKMCQSLWKQAARQTTYNCSQLSVAEVRVHVSSHEALSRSLGDPLLYIGVHHHHVAGPSGFDYPPADKQNKQFL